MRPFSRQTTFRSRGVGFSRSCDLVSKRPRDQSPVAAPPECLTAVMPFALRFLGVAERSTERTTAQEMEAGTLCWIGLGQIQSFLFGIFQLLDFSYFFFNLIPLVFANTIELSSIQVQRDWGFGLTSGDIASLFHKHQIKRR